MPPWVVSLVLLLAGFAAGLGLGMVTGADWLRERVGRQIREERRRRALTAQPKQQDTVCSGAATGPARNGEANGLHVGLVRKVADDGGKTPASGSMRIQNSENGATETRPKLRDDLGGLTPGEGMRVKVEAVTGGERPAHLGSKGQRS